MSQRPDVVAGIRDLLTQQPFAVLCTQGRGQPYGSVIAYAINEALDTAVFSTGRATTKYGLLKECDRVAVVVDSRSSSPDDFVKAEAVTAIGRARELPDQAGGSWAELLTARHPRLRSFVSDDSTAIFRVDIEKYRYVTRFQDVREWVPGTVPGSDRR